MRAYSAIEKDFMRMIVEKTPASDKFFQRTLSDHFFSDGFRPFVFIGSGQRRVILFFSGGRRHEQFFRFFTLLGLIEELERSGLIIRLPMTQGTYFISDIFADADCDGQRVTSKSTGKYIELHDWSKLYDSSGQVEEHLDPVVFDDPKFFERLSYAFSGIVYPTEAMRDLVQNRFRSVEARRHRRTMFAAWSGIGLSLLLSLAPVTKAVICDFVPSSLACNSDKQKGQ